LIPLEYAREVEDRAIATVLTAMAGMAAHIGGADLQLRRRVDEIVREAHIPLAAVLSELADRAGEPPLTTDSEENERAHV